MEEVKDLGNCMLLCEALRLVTATLKGTRQVKERKKKKGRLQPHPWAQL